VRERRWTDGALYVGSPDAVAPACGHGGDAERRIDGRELPRVRALTYGTPTHG
jgi:hypothetical protein